MGMDKMEKLAETRDPCENPVKSRALPGDLRSSSSFGYLPNTLTEVEHINSMLDTRKWGISLNTGDNANEPNFKSLSGDRAPMVLHIATHGFYFAAPEQKRKQPINKQGMENPFRYADDPLLRTGLILSGANTVWTGGELPPGVDDGILTAYEVSNMDLRKTQLVVLSACETGLGDIKGGEGVFGLQRAFHLAGAGSIMMSLWPVPDKETRELMEMFYTNWMTGMSLYDAFSESQKAMRNKYPNNPEKWAAFVLVE